MAHKFHEMRGGADKSVLPASVVAPNHRNRVPGRSLSGLIRELRDELQTPAERQEEARSVEAARARELDREAVRGFAQEYARLTGDPTAAALVHKYVQQQLPRLDRNAILEMREALHVVGDPGGDYLAVPEAARWHCLEMCLALDKGGDSRLLLILDAAEKRRMSGEERIYEQYPVLTREVEDPDLERDIDLDNRIRTKTGPVA